MPRRGRAARRQSSPTPAAPGPPWGSRGAGAPGKGLEVRGARGSIPPPRWGRGGALQPALAGKAALWGGVSVSAAQQAGEGGCLGEGPGPAARRGAGARSPLLARHDCGTWCRGGGPAAGGRPGLLGIGAETRARSRSLALSPPPPLRGKPLHPAREQLRAGGRARAEREIAAPLSPKPAPGPFAAFPFPPPPGSMGVDRAREGCMGAQSMRSWAPGRLPPKAAEGFVLFEGWRGLSKTHDAPRALPAALRMKPRSEAPARTRPCRPLHSSPSHSVSPVVPPLFRGWGLGWGAQPFPVHLLLTAARPSGLPQLSPPPRSLPAGAPSSLTPVGLRGAPRRRGGGAAALLQATEERPGYSVISAPGARAPKRELAGTEPQNAQVPLRTWGEQRTAHKPQPAPLPPPAHTRSGRRGPFHLKLLPGADKDLSLERE
ncbi:collagen alpha-1(I) chain [Lepus europaeus]|uniref:collagen alpha-1(I) chain n=1 Tax=Lepus europaeus TaxID=9983 RepID=UPI002B49E7B1|nr:collagen alpha-1(I) chain [Lepus europaeus]